MGGWEEGVIRILQSLIGVIRSIYHERTKILLPTPLPQVMNDDKPTFSYSMYLFIQKEYQKELFYLEYLGLVPINLCLAFIWMKFGLLLYREVRKKCFPSGSWVSHL